MGEFVVKIPEELERTIKEFPEVDWGKLARNAIREKAVKLSLLKSIASKSKLTEEDALELGREVNKGLHERYKKLYPGLK